MLPTGCERSLEVYELSQFHSREIDHLLKEEVDCWRRDLLWNYASSSALVSQFIDARALAGVVLCADDKPIGYSYFISEDRKALMGCLFLTEAHRDFPTERRLLEATLDAIRRRPPVRRVEGQFMLQSMPQTAPPLAEWSRVHERLFMAKDLRGPLPPMPPEPSPKLMRIEPWNERFQDRAAFLIEEAYRGHLDSTINDQYRTVDGARRFLYNIIQYPGCGTFAPYATFSAVEKGKGHLAGCCLCSLVEDHVGHITQICTAPRARGTGLGRYLLLRSLRELTLQGCIAATLTVTADNTAAIRLYEQLGFHVLRRFPAYVWDGL